MQRQVTSARLSHHARNPPLLSSAVYRPLSGKARPLRKDMHRLPPQHSKASAAASPPATAYRFYPFTRTRLGRVEMVIDGGRRQLRQEREPQQRPRGASCKRYRTHTLNVYRVRPASIAPLDSIESSLLQLRKLPRWWTRFWNGIGSPRMRKGASGLSSLHGSISKSANSQSGVVAISSIVSQRRGGGRRGGLVNKAPMQSRSRERRNIEPIGLSCTFFASSGQPSRE